MKIHSIRIGLSRILITIAALATGELVSIAEIPSWWLSQGVLKLDGANQPISPNDWAAINQGQLKNFTSAARLELQEKLPGGAGSKIESLVAGFGTNLAIRPNTTATQSSTALDAAADRARDNNTDGIFANGSVTHTNEEANPWWQTDLGFSSPIKSVEIWNRTDCCGDRTTDFYVFLAATDMSQRTLGDLLADSNVWKSPKITAVPNPSLTVQVGEQTGRFVMVRLEGTRSLHLAEIKVIRGTEDYAAATVGQLKAVSLPFYRRFNDIGLGAVYPWPAEGTGNDYAIANIGQAKNLFSFDLSDEDTDGLFDAWEKHYGLNPNFPGDAAVDDDGDGLTNLEEFSLRTAPLNFHSGSPSITIATGDGQTGDPNAWSQPFSLLIKDKMGRPLGGAPVNIAITSGGGALSASEGGTETPILLVSSATNGLIRFYSKLPATAFKTQRISVTTGSTSIGLSASTRSVGGEEAPSELQLIRSGDASLTLTWKDNSTNETGFNIYRKLPETEWQLTATLPPNSTSYSDASVILGETYVYTVDAL